MRTGRPKAALILTDEERQRLESHQSVSKLKATIQAFIDAHQENPKPFVWTKTADQILASIARFAQRTFEVQAAQHVSRTTGTGHQVF